MEVAATTKVNTKDSEPFHTRYSDVYGQVSIFAPNTDVTEWAGSPWRLVTQYDGTRLQGRGKDILVRSEFIMEAFRSPSLMVPSWLYQD